VSTQIALRIDRLKSLREQRRLSQRELARLCGLGETQINKYENGLSDPSSTNLMLIARQLDVSTDFLLGVSDDPHVQVREPGLNVEEHQMLETFRREGWPGVFRLGAERLSK
jgi:transcriptional regulator with XRE-family HTH domain